MREINGDIWDFHTKGEYICIPTNGIKTRDGYAIMGKGLALQCSKRFENIRLEIGYRINLFGNIPHFIKRCRIITFPTKNDWRDKSDIELIKKSARLLIKLIEDKEIAKVYLPRVGCGEGGLDWNIIKEVLDHIFDNDERIIFVKFNGNKRITFY